MGTVGTIMKTTDGRGVTGLQLPPSLLIYLAVISLMRIWDLLWVETMALF